MVNLYPARMDPYCVCIRNTQHVIRIQMDLLDKPISNFFCQNGEKFTFEFVIHWIMPTSSEYFYSHSIVGTHFQVIDEYFAMTLPSKIQQNSLKNWHKGMMPWRDGRNVVMRRTGRILPPSTQNSIHLELTHQQV